MTYCILYKYVLLLIIPFTVGTRLQNPLQTLLDSNINNTHCFIAIKHTIQSALKGESWALKILDAAPKLSSGQLLGGNLFLGQYDECLSAEEPKGRFVGKYCLLLSNLTKVERELSFLEDAGQPVGLFQTGICIPSVCSNENIEQLLKNISYNVLHYKLLNNSCITREFKLPLLKMDYVFIALVLFITILSFLSTFYDCYQRFHLNIDRPDPLYSSFSLFTNTKSLLKVDDVSQFGCLHGLKALSMFGIVYGHTALEFLIGNIFNRAEMMLDVPSLKWTSFNNAHNITDTFFVMGAMLIVVSFFREIKAKGGYDFPLAVLKRYLRLTPTYALLLLFTMSLKKYLIVGPTFPMLYAAHSAPCYDNWQWCLTYLQNYQRPVNKCLGHSWYLDVDMQLFWMSPLLLYPALWWPKFGAILAIAAALSVSTYEFYLGLYYDLGPAVTYARSFHHLRYDHFFTHTRSAPWFLGIFLGLIFCKILSKGKDSQLTKRTQWLCWTLFGGIFFLCQVALTFFGYDYEQPLAALCLAYRRLGWGLGVGWIIIACTTNYGGALNKFLCWGPFSYFSKISYNVYLIHLPIIEIVYSKARESSYGTLAEVMAYFMLFTVLSTFAASIMCICVEIPCSRIIKIAFRNVEIFQYPKNKKSASREEI